MINIRNFMLPHYFKHPDDNKALFTNWASDVDYRHMNDKAHVALGVSLPSSSRTISCLCDLVLGHDVSYLPLLLLGSADLVMQHRLPARTALPSSA